MSDSAKFTPKKNQNFQTHNNTSDPKPGEQRRCQDHEKRRHLLEPAGGELTPTTHRAVGVALGEEIQ